LEEEVKRLKAIEKEMLAAPDQQVSFTDPDSRSMATSGRGSGIVGYNVQAVGRQALPTPPKKAPPLAKVPCLASSVQAVAGGRSHRTVVRRCSSSRFASRNARARVGAIASSHADEPGSICPGLRVQILETDSDAVYPDSRLPPDHYWRLGWSCAALTRGEIIFADRGCENESSEFSRWWRN